MWFSKSGNVALDLLQVVVVFHDLGKPSWTVLFENKETKLGMDETDGEDLIQALGGLS